jgi:hypothetical protein
MYQPKFCSAITDQGVPVVVHYRQSADQRLGDHVAEILTIGRQHQCRSARERRFACIAIDVGVKFDVRDLLSGAETFEALDVGSLPAADYQ